MEFVELRTNIINNIFRAYCIFVYDENKDFYFGSCYTFIVRNEEIFRMFISNCEYPKVFEIKSINKFKSFLKSIVRNSIKSFFDNFEDNIIFYKSHRIMSIVESQNLQFITLIRNHIRMKKDLRKTKAFNTLFGIS